MSCFDVLSGPSKAESGEELSKNVEHHMTAILVALVDESENLPSEVVDCILAQFLRADPRATNSVGKGKKGAPLDEKQSTLLLREAPPAYNMAKNICNTSPEKMSRYVSQYFSTVVLDSSTGGRGRRDVEDMDDSEDDTPQGPSEEDVQELRKAHSLLRELWRSTPDVLAEIVPQIEAEFGAEDVSIRLLATETMGDMIAGIGAAGPPPVTALNPAVYPSQSLASSSAAASYNFLTTPNAPFSFASHYHDAYRNFLSRRHDKAPTTRAAWAKSIGRIITTGAGGVGLGSNEEQQLLHSLADLLVDADDKVRFAAIKAVEAFDYQGILQKIGSGGGASDAGSVLGNLADRVKDRKHPVRVEAIQLLGNIWGVAAGAIAEGSERASKLLGPIASRILDAYYINDTEINALVDNVLFQALFPVSYPPIKASASNGINGASQRRTEGQQDGLVNPTESDVDRIRAERLLVLIKSLDTRAKTVLFAKATQQPQHASATEVFLKKCEDYNGGVSNKDSKQAKEQLGKIIEYFVKQLPDPSKVSEDLWKFAKMHDRRSYQLIRFCMAPDSDFRKVYRAMKELWKRIEDSSSASSTMVNTLSPIVYRSSVLIFNRSHVPAVIDFTRNNEKDLSSAAHELLSHISTRAPDVFKAHVKELCRSLELEAPSSKKVNSASAVSDLKACAGFAEKFPKEVPKDRKFVQSMIDFAIYGQPPQCGKYAVKIILSISDKKSMHARDVLGQCTKDFKYGSSHFVTKLAALSQLMLTGSKEVEDDIDGVIDIAIGDILLREGEKADQGDDVWTDEPNSDCLAKEWALKILVNRIRSAKDDESIKELAGPVYKLLNSLVQLEGRVNQKDQPPNSHRPRMRLLAGLLLLKLSATDAKVLDPMLTPIHFNNLVKIVQDPLPEVRGAFVNKLMKYLGQGCLGRRFYTLLFLLEFEVEKSIQKDAMTWIKSRCNALRQKQDTTMELIFAHFISLLAHHPDYEKEPELLQYFAKYIIFYLRCVATQENLGLIFHVAQRVKSVQDNIDRERSANLYCLSELAQAVIRAWEEQHGWSMQTWPTKAKMPAGIFAAMPDLKTAQQVSDKRYVSAEEMESIDVDTLVKKSLQVKKVSPSRPRSFQHMLRLLQRKRDSDTANPQKRARTDGVAPSSPLSTRSLPVRKQPAKKSSTKTPAKSKKVRKFESDAADVPSSERRRSGRQSTGKNYIEQDDEDDDAEMEDWNKAAEEGEEEGADEPKEESQEDVEPAKEAPAEAETAVEQPTINGAEEHEDEEEPPAEEEAEAEAEPTPQRSTRTRSNRAVNGVAKSSPAAAKSSPKTNGVTKTKDKPLPKDKSTPKKTTTATAKEKATEKAKPSPRTTRARGKPVVEISSAEEESDDDDE